MTNADKLRAMSNEELYDFLNAVTDCCTLRGLCVCCPMRPKGRYCDIEKWLKSEAGE